MKKRNSPAYQKLADTLRNAVLQGDLKPGVRLKIDELAHRFKTSATPVRQALQALEDEGIVVTQMNKGAAVRVIDAQLAAHLYDLRRAILGLVVSDCVSKLAAGDLKILRQAADGQKSANMASAQESQRMFFEKIANIGGNMIAADMLNRHWSMLVAVREFYGLTNGAVVDRDQSELLNALEQGDTGAAIKSAQQACETAKAELMARMQAHTTATG